MSDTLPALGLPLIQPAQAQKHVTHNEALRILDVLTQLAVQDSALGTPPPAPDPGQRWLVPAGATGAWAGRDTQIAVYEGGYWSFYSAAPGWLAFDLAQGRLLHFTAGTWAPMPEPASLGQMDGIGINTDPDAVNRLAVQAEATLLSHEGAGHQLKLNKAASTDTGSLLFQTGWTGHAEIGLTGSDDLAIRVSADGSQWADALQVPADGSAVRIDPPITGLAVQQDAQDGTAGRLMRADYGVLRSAMTGPVAMTGGQPSGAIIESGENASGRYTRFADGTQICTRLVVIDLNTVDAQDFSLPAAMTAVDGGSVAGADILQATGSGSTVRREALFKLPLWVSDTIWRVRLRSALGADTLSARLTAIGRWV